MTIRGWPLRNCGRALIRYPRRHRPLIEIDDRERLNFAAGTRAKDRRLRQVAVAHLLQHTLPENRRVEAKAIDVFDNIPTHRLDLTGDAGAMLTNVGLSDHLGTVENRSGALRIPEFDTALEQDRRENDDEKCRHNCDDGKQRNETDLQPPFPPVEDLAARRMARRRAISTIRTMAGIRIATSIAAAIGGVTTDSGRVLPEISR